MLKGGCSPSRPFLSSFKESPWPQQPLYLYEDHTRLCITAIIHADTSIT